MYLGGVYWTKSELFLKKIRTLNFDCRVLRGRNKNFSTRAGKNSFPPHPFFFLPACWGQTIFSCEVVIQKPDVQIRFLHYLIAEINLSQLTKILASRSLYHSVDCVSSKCEDCYNNQQTNNDTIGAECYDTTDRCQ